jgi:hypothetical protein
MDDLFLPIGGPRRLTGTAITALLRAAEARRNRRLTRPALNLVGFGAPSNAGRPHFRRSGTGPSM